MRFTRGVVERAECIRSVRRRTGYRGFGSGPAVVSYIANRYAGSVEIETARAAGASFLLTFPLAR
jgi:C4-dicarboxylate-specific signal transduction histidine kinase